MACLFPVHEFYRLLNNDNGRIIFNEKNTRNSTNTVPNLVSNSARKLKREESHISQNLKSGS